MNKKSKEIVKKLCFTLVIVISIITIIGCPNTVSNKANGTDNKEPNPPPPSPSPTDPNDWSGLTADQVIQKMRFTDDDPIVTDYCGLGFGEKDKGKFRILTYGPDPSKIDEFKDYLFTESPEGSKRRLWSLEVVNNYISNNSLGPLVNVTDFTTVQKGLEERWKAAKETKTKPGATDCFLFFSDGSTAQLDEYLSGKLGDSKKHMLKNKALYRFSDTGQYLAVSRNKNIFVYIGDSILSHFVDWHVVFVPNDEPRNPYDLELGLYSFHYGPYTLWNKKENDDPLVLGNEDKDNIRIHMFTLSEMLKDTLGKKHKVKEHLATVLKDFPPFKYKKNYDVYLVIGRYVRDGQEYCGYRWLRYSFRNVLKLSGDAYGERWHNCWSNDESDEDGFPEPVRKIV